MGLSFHSPGLGIGGNEQYITVFIAFIFLVWNPGNGPSQVLYFMYSVVFLLLGS